MASTAWAVLVQFLASRLCAAVYSSSKLDEANRFHISKIRIAILSQENQRPMSNSCRAFYASGLEAGMHWPNRSHFR